MSNTYWNNKGKYQREYDALWKHVPMRGMTKDKFLNALIGISKIYYDVYNNDLCNEEVVLDYAEDYIREIIPYLSEEEQMVVERALKEKTQIEEVEEPVYVVDEEGYETDEVDYYSTNEEEVVNLTQDDYNDYERAVDAIVKLAYDKGFVTGMTKDEAHIHMLEGCKMIHRDFSKGEYLYIGNDGIIRSESSDNFTKWWNDSKEESFQTGWFIEE